MIVDSVRIRKVQEITSVFFLFSFWEWGGGWLTRWVCIGRALSNEVILLE